MKHKHQIPRVLRHDRSQTGFTLLEVMISLMIVSISFAAIMTLLWTTMAANKSNDLDAKAKDLATQKVEELISTPREVVDSSYLTPTSPNAYTSDTEYLTEKGEVTDSSNSKGNALFIRRWSINQVPNLSVQTNPKPVVVSSVVQYTYKGKTRSKSFSTMWSF